MESNNITNRKLLLIGGGGHGKSVYDSAVSSGLYCEIGIVVNDINDVDTINVVGNDNDLPDLAKNGWTDAFIAIGSIGDTTLRRKIYKLITEYRFRVPTIIDPSAIIAENTTIAKGVFVGKGAIINEGSRIGLCSIVNTGAIVEHDCVIGEFSHISPGSTLCGDVNVGHDTHIGAGSVIRQSISIGNSSMIGAGSVVLNDIPDFVKAYGSPCKVVG